MAELAGIGARRVLGQKPCSQYNGSSVRHLQSAAGGCVAGQRSLLVRSPAAAGEVPRGDRQPARNAAAAFAFLGRGRQAGDLGACGFGRRDSCRGRTDPGNAQAFRGLRHCHLHHHQHGPQAGGRSLRPGECFLFPARSQLRRSPLHAPASAKAGGHCRNRVLAQFSADRAPLRCGGRGGECAHFRPFVSALPEVCLSAAPGIAERGSLPGADRGRRTPSCRHRRRARPHP